MSKREDHFERFAGNLRSTFSGPPDDETRTRHLAAMSEILVSQTSPAPRRRRRFGLFPKAALAGAATLLATGAAMAGTGTLPDPAQNAVSSAAHTIGISIPRGESAEHANPNGIRGQQHADDNRDRAKTFVAKKKDWNECAKTARDQAGTGPVDVEQACGPKPHPEQAQNDAVTAPGRSETAPGHSATGPTGPGNSANAPGHTREHPPVPANAHHANPNASK